MGMEKMLWMYLLQVWFNLYDEGVEDVFYDSYAFRRFMGVDFVEEQVPDATTLLKFQHLLEKNHLSEAFFKAINRVTFILPFEFNLQVFNPRKVCF